MNKSRDNPVFHHNFKTAISLKESVAIGPVPNCSCRSCLDLAWDLFCVCLFFFLNYSACYGVCSPSLPELIDRSLISLHFRTECPLCRSHLINSHILPKLAFKFYFVKKILKVSAIYNLCNNEKPVKIRAFSKFPGLETIRFFFLLHFKIFVFISTVYITWVIDWLINRAKSSEISSSQTDIFHK